LRTFLSAHQLMMDNKHINMTDSCWLVLYFFVAKFDATQMNSIWWRICFWIQNFRRGLAVKCRVFLLEISWSWEIRLWLCTIEFWSVINPTAVGVCRPFFLKQQGVVYYKIKCSVVILMCIQASYLTLDTTGNTATHVQLLFW
jgi:hypothetical protein